MKIPRALLIVHNNDLRQLYHEILISEHWEVVSAETIADALVQLVLNRKINLIILDTQFASNELSRFLKSLGSKVRWQTIPICFLDADFNERLPGDLLKLFKTTHVSTHQTTPDQLIETLKVML